MPARYLTALLLIALALFVPIARTSLRAQQSTADKKPSQKSANAKPASPAEELQKAISAAGNDRTALVKNLQAYLEKYPSAPERPQIYRALVEACLQFHDDGCAANYAERIVALTPEDTSMTLLAIELLERSGDRDGQRRAVTYATRVYETVHATPISEKSPRVSVGEWEDQKARDESAMMALRGKLEERLGDQTAARNDYQASYTLRPNTAAALKLGEIEELAKNYNSAATQYARAFALSDTATKSTSRREIRQKLGNAWRLAHGGEAGLGDFLLRIVDEVTASAAPLRERRNGNTKDAFNFVLRRAPDGAAYPLSAQKGKVLVINFWATWCGPCHALEPLYEKLAGQYSGNEGLRFLSANCDEDESLVGPYLAQRKPHSTELFSDGLAEVFGVQAFPTLVILDRSGKVVFRANGFDPNTIEHELDTAIQRAIQGAI